MCTYATITAALDGSVKGPGGRWFHVTDGTVYFDHPVHAMAEHAQHRLRRSLRGPSARVAVELSAGSARELMDAIAAALDSAPAELTA